MSDFELALQQSTKNLPQNAAVQTTVGRYTQEVQGMVFMAKQFPRNQIDAWQRIKQACQRKSLAEVAQYAYPRGGEKVSGPSIRLAEVIAQNWGNMTYGITELEQKPGESTCMAYAWDLETNVRSEKIFSVKHERHTKSGVKKLNDPRDIYELVANYGARRMRSCILAVIPKDVVDAAMEECEQTLLGGNKEPIQDRLKRMIDKFSEYGVTREMIEKRVGYKLENFTEKDVLSLGKIYNSLRDGVGNREDYFEVSGPQTHTQNGDDLAAEFEKYQKEQQAKGQPTAQGSLFGDGDPGATDQS
ncbi:MAG: hypothetical protein ACOY9Y_10785 [Bacillota bacterium]